MNSHLGYRVRLVQLLSGSKGSYQISHCKESRLENTAVTVLSSARAALLEIDANRLGTLKSSQFLTRLSDSCHFTNICARSAVTFSKKSLSFQTNPSRNAPNAAAP